MNEKKYDEHIKRLTQLVGRTMISIFNGGEFVRLWFEKKLFRMKFVIGHNLFQFKNVVLYTHFREHPERLIYRMFYGHKDGLFVLRAHKYLMTIETLPTVFVKGDENYRRMVLNQKTTTKKRRKQIEEFVKELFYWRLCDRVWALSVAKEEAILKKVDFILQNGKLPDECGPQEERNSLERG